MIKSTKTLTVSFFKTWRKIGRVSRWSHLNGETGVFGRVSPNQKVTMFYTLQLFYFSHYSLQSYTSNFLFSFAKISAKFRKLKINFTIIF